MEIISDIVRKVDEIGGTLTKAKKVRRQRGGDWWRSLYVYIGVVCVCGVCRGGSRRGSLGGGAHTLVGGGAQ